MTETDVFLTHDWGIDEKGRNNHDRVLVINNALQDRGYCTWFDHDRMHGDIPEQMADGIDNTKLVLVFITERYRDKVNGKNPNDNCRLEFQHALHTKTRDGCVCVLMEKRMEATQKWGGILGLYCGTKMYIDMTGDVEDNSYLKKQLDLLCDEMTALGVLKPDPSVKKVTAVPVATPKALPPVEKVTAKPVEKPKASPPVKKVTAKPVEKPKASPPVKKGGENIFTKHTNTEYKYQVAFTEAHRYERFTFECPNINSDIHIGFSSKAGHVARWEIVIGACNGSFTLIRDQNQGDDLLKVPHDRSFFQDVREEFDILLLDGLIQIVTDLATNDCPDGVMQLRDVRIKKNDLQYLQITTGFGSSGDWKITAHKVTTKPTPAPTPHDPPPSEPSEGEENIFTKYTNTEYKYQVAFTEAHVYERFTFECPKINSDICVGFSSRKGHNVKKWEIVIGACGGNYTLIRDRNQGDNLLEVQHGRSFFEEVREQFDILVLDGQIQIITDLSTGACPDGIMQLKDARIKKDELKYLQITTGFGGSGNWKITAHEGTE